MTIAIETNPLHPATACCLEALQWLHERHAVKSVLDIGCGNGILSLIAAGLWKAPVLATDISQQAVEDTAAHSAEHHLDPYITTLRSDGFNDPVIRARAPYDLIIINLLAEPIVKMLPDVGEHLAEGGMCILSGIRSWEAELTEGVYTSAGFHVLTCITRAPWHTFVMARRV